MIAAVSAAQCAPFPARSLLAQFTSLQRSLLAFAPSNVSIWLRRVFGDRSAESRFFSLIFLCGREARVAP
jgi:hypothetical protein